MRVLDLPLLFDEESGASRELSPLEIDAITVYGESIVRLFSINGPTGGIYAS